MGWLRSWGAAGRTSDRRATRPAGLAYGLGDTPRTLTTVSLALQHLAVQSVYIAIPAAMAASLTSDPVAITRFISLSLAACAIWQLLQLLTRGPVGSGYPVPANSAASLLGSYALAGAASMDFAAAGAMVMLGGGCCVLIALLLRRPRLVFPNEVAAVIVILIGVTVVNLGAQQIGLQRAGVLPDRDTLAVIVATLASIAGIALSRTRAAALAVLFGAIIGTLVAIALGQTPTGGLALLAGQPWVALPEPWAPRFDNLALAPTLSFLIAMIAVKANTFGTLVIFQRAADARWSRPDGPPIRRGLLANGLGGVFAGLLGAAAPAPSTAALGLSVATGTLARPIVAVGAALLLVLAFCPKLVMLSVLVPDAVKAAVLFYVAGFILAQGCQLVAARLLDTRRTLIVAFGLAAGLLVALAPQAFVDGMPGLASPLALGAVVAFTVHLVTLPLVGRRARLRVTLADEAGAARRVTEWFGRIGGAWGVKPQTLRAADHALTELADLLAARGVPEIEFGAALTEDRVVLTVGWAGTPLPPRARRPHVEDLLADDVATREAFSVWLATRETQSCTQRATVAGMELRLVFED